MNAPTTTAAAATRAALATLAQSGIYITVTATPEDPREVYGQLGDCMSKKQIQELLEKAEDNVWHWCSITVRAEHTDDDGNEYSAEEYLGMCSYKSRADFMEQSGYFEEMLATVVEDIRQQLASQPRTYASFYAPDIISSEDRASAYFHCMGPEDKADIIRRVAPERAPELTNVTHLLSRCTDINGEVWATTDSRPHRKKALYTRIK